MLKHTLRLTALLALPLSLQAQPARDVALGMVAAELVLARAERAELGVVYGEAHPSMQEVAARIARLEAAAPGPATSAESQRAAARRLHPALARATARRTEALVTYKERHPRVRALTARIEVLRAALEGAPPLPSAAAISRVAAGVRLARLDGRRHFHAARGYGERHPEVVRDARERAQLQARLGEAPIEGLLEGLLEATLVIDREEARARAASDDLARRRLAHERDAVLIQARRLAAEAQN